MTSIGTSARHVRKTRRTGSAYQETMVILVNDRVQLWSMANAFRKRNDTTQNSATKAAR